MSSVLDDRDRVVLPKVVAEDLGLAPGDAIIFQKAKQGYLLRKLGKRKGKANLKEIMDWDPKRGKKPEPVSPSEMKATWKVQ